MMMIRYFAYVRGAKTVLKTEPYAGTRWTTVQNTCLALESERGLPKGAVETELIDETEAK